MPGYPVKRDSFNELSPKCPVASKKSSRLSKRVSDMGQLDWATGLSRMWSGIMDGLVLLRAHMKS